MLKEFREFAMKGNVLDLAIGIIIGAAFGKIVTSFVSDLLTPILGLLLGQVNFSALSVGVGDATIKYGAFIQSVIDFVIVAFAIFLMVKQINRFQRKPSEEPGPTTKECSFCFSTIPLPATRCPQCTSQLS